VGQRSRAPLAISLTARRIQLAADLNQKIISLPKKPVTVSAQRWFAYAVAASRDIGLRHLAYPKLRKV